MHECYVASAVSDSLCPYELQPSRLLCLWDSLGKNTGVGGHVLLQGTFLTQGLNPHLLQLLHCGWIFFFFLLSHQGSPETLPILNFFRKKCPNTP